jgi:hypothetical protein
VAGDEVGNNRFQILLQIHREAYNLARLGGDTTECERIVDKIVNTVCVECVPNGRFLERLSSFTDMTEGQWRELFPPEVKTAVQVLLGGAPLFAPVPPQALQQPDLSSAALDSVLQNAAIFAEISRRRDALRRSISESMVMSNFPPPPPALSNGANGVRRAHSAYVPIQPDPNTLSPNLTMSNLATDRRASAPEPEASRWTPNYFLQFDHDTKAPPAPAPAPPPNLPPIPDNSMDIIFAKDGESISSSTHAGNNRFRILVDLQTKSFQQAGKNSLVQDKILQEMMESVNSWSGRFLIESDHQYQFMSTPHVKSCLRAILNIRGLRSTEIDVLKSRRERRESTRVVAEKMAKSVSSNQNYNPDDDVLM